MIIKYWIQYYHIDLWGKSDEKNIEKNYLVMN